MAALSFLAATAYLASGALAVLYGQELGGGPSPAQAPVLFQNSSRQPELTNTVGLLYGTRVLNWRVNITNVIVGNATTGLGEPITPNAHIAYTTYDFSWAEDSMLGEATSDFAEDYGVEDGSPVSLCAWVLTGMMASKATTSCADAIGDKCVKNMLAGVTCMGSQLLQQPDVHADGCGKSTGKTNTGVGTMAGFYLGNSSDEAGANGTAVLPQMDQAFFYSMSDASNDTENANYEHMEDTLQILVIAAGNQSVMGCQSFNKGVVPKSAAASNGATVLTILMGGAFLLALAAWL